MPQDNPQGQQGPPLPLPPQGKGTAQPTLGLVPVSAPREKTSATTSYYTPMTQLEWEGGIQPPPPLLDHARPTPRPLSDSVRRLVLPPTLDSNRLLSQGREQPSWPLR